MRYKSCKLTWLSAESGASSDSADGFAATGTGGNRAWPLGNALKCGWPTHSSAGLGDSSTGAQKRSSADRVTHGLYQAAEITAATARTPATSKNVFRLLIRLDTRGAGVSGTTGTTIGAAIATLFSGSAGM